MKLKLSLFSFLIILSLLVTSTGTAASMLYATGTSPAVLSPLGSAFTYQGRLMDDGTPANGTYNLIFFLWADQAKTTLLGTVPSSGSLSVMVTDGFFNVTLDFGGGLFTGEARWLEIEVNGTLLSPLQSLTAAPYALFSQASPWSGLMSVPAGFADNIDNDSLAGCRRESLYPSFCPILRLKWDAGTRFWQNNELKWVISMEKLASPTSC